MSTKIEIIPAKLSDEQYLIEWFSDPDILHWFPMCDHREILDSSRIWINYSKIGSVLSAVYQKEVVGSAILYIQPYPKLSHQCLFAIIVKKEMRNKGIGTKLIQELMKLGKETFGLEMLHLEVYEGNPAFELYKRMGFEVYGKQSRFLKEEGRYYDKILMQQML